MMALESLSHCLPYVKTSNVGRVLLVEMIK
jgi:hypothetical protein